MEETGTEEKLGVLNFPLAFVITSSNSENFEQE